MENNFVFIGNLVVGTALSENLVSAGFEAGSGPEDSRFILTFCETQSDLEDLYFDTDGLVQRAQKDSVLVNLGATTPGFARELNAVALVNDLHVVEAPLVVKDVTVADAYADARNLCCFVAGEEGDVQATLPLLSALTYTQKPTGASGTAQLAKAAITLQSASQLIACMEAEALFKTASASSADAVRFAQEQGYVDERALHLLEAVREERFAGAYTIQICMAELTAALMTADDVDLILPGAEACMHLLELIAVIGGSEMAVPALSLVYGEEALCAKHGLDWTRAEEAYSEECGDCEDYEDCEDCGHTHSQDEYPGGFGGYSSN